MRTTMNLPDALIEAAKDRAAEQGRTVTSLMEEALRDLLAKAEPAGADLEPLPTWGTPDDGGLLVDIADPDALWETLDSERVG